MSVKVIFECDGCDAKTDAAVMSRHLGAKVGAGLYLRPTVEGAFHKASEDAAPGWVTFDPYTSCCYCPDCWSSIVRDPEVAEVSS